MEERAPCDGWVRGVDDGQWSVGNLGRLTRRGVPL